MKRYINLILIFVAVAALAVATVEYKRMFAAAKTNNDATAAVLKRNAAMKARLDSLKQAFPQSADTGGTVTDAETSALRAAKNRADKQAREGSEHYKQYRAKAEADAKMLAERLKNDPEFALKHYAALRGQADMKDAPFRRMQNLSPEQNEALTDAEFQRMMRLDDMRTAQQLNEQGVDAKTITKEANDEFASSARAALGDDLYEQFLAYQRQSEAWDYVSGHGSSLSLADMPLSVEQASQLVDAISNASPAYQKGGAVDTFNVHWKAVDAAAADFLTPEQMDFIKNTDERPGDVFGWLSRPQTREWINELQKKVQ